MVSSTNRLSSTVRSRPHRQLESDNRRRPCSQFGDLRIRDVDQKRDRILSFFIQCWCRRLSRSSRDYYLNQEMKERKTNAVFTRGMNENRNTFVTFSLLIRSSIPKIIRVKIDETNQTVRNIPSMVITFPYSLEIV